MTKRIRRAGVLIGLLAVSYAIKLVGDRSADLFTDMGRVYECRTGQLYNGSDCVRMGSVISPSPPCYLGWEQRGNTCVWKG